MKYLKVMVSVLLIGGLLLNTVGCDAGSAAAEDFLVQKKDPEAADLNVDYDEHFAESIARVSAKLDDFSVTLLAQLPEDQQIISPMSLYMALLNLRLGLEDGSVARQFDELMQPDNMDDDVYMKVMHQLVALYGDSSDEELNVDMSQLVVAQEDPEFRWNGSYLKRVKPLLTDVGTLDFSDQKAVMTALNGWADERTKGLIPKIFESPEEVDPAIRMMILNTIYFSGKWETEFNTQPIRKTFHGKDKESELDFMNAESDFFYSERDGIQIVSLPYNGGAEMEIALGTPDKPLEQVAAALFSQPAGSLEKCQGLVVMPPYELESKISLNDTLNKMGLGAMFDDLGPNDYFEEQHALSVSSVVQNVKVKVDREGTEAAAVTRIAVNESAAPVEPVKPFTMVIDHPFVFRIVYQGMPLFAGIVKNL